MDSKPSRNSRRPPHENKAMSIAWAIAGLILATGVAYLPVLKAGYLWDDEALTENPQVRSVSGLPDIWLHPGTNRFEAHYWPVTYTSFWIEHRLWGDWPAGYHLTNLLLHALNGVLLFLLLRRMKLSGAWAAAAVFAVHPVHVESVAWIIERKDVLSAAFYLGAFLLLTRYWEQGRRQGDFILALVCFAAAMLSKSIAVSFPLAAGLWLWWKEGKITRKTILILTPFLLAAVVIAGLDVRYAGHRESADFGFSFLERLGIAGRAIVFYAGKLLWPYPLMTFYPRWDVEIPPLGPLIHPSAVGAVLVGLWAARGRIGRGPLALALYYCVTLGPVLGLIDFHFMSLSFVADRFQYLASAGLIVLICEGACRLREHLPGHLRKTAPYAGMGILVLLAALTFRQARLYRGDETLFQHNVAWNPKAWAAHNNLGLAIGTRARSQTEWDEAMKHYRLALAAKPDFADAHINLGVALGRRGEYDEAIGHFRAALRMKPRSIEARNNLGFALLSRGDYAEAARELERGIALEPDDAAAHFHLAYAWLGLGETRKAVVELEWTLALDPERTAAANRLAWILATSNDDSLRDGSRAVELAEAACERTKYSNASYLDTLAAAYAETRRFEDAADTMRRAMNILRSRPRPTTEDLNVVMENELDTMESRLRLYENRHPLRETMELKN